jgi:thiosulfate/3-mercaptopyruvate sulfurtransferase
MTHFPLVTTDWLAQHLHDANLRIIDIRGHVIPASEPMPQYFNHYDDYIKSHVPNAVFVDWVHEITDPADRRHAQIAPPERYAEVISKLGINDDTFVVAYDDANSMFAARLWWSLHYYGHPNVAVLDGGWKKWTQENHPITAEIPTITPAQFTPSPNLMLRKTADDVAAKLNTETKVD